MEVLIAPAHFELVDKYGGEPHIATQVIKGISKYVDKAHVICHHCDASFDDNVIVHELGNGRDSCGVKKMFAYNYFLLSYASYAERIAKRIRIDLIHHMFPFGFGASYNDLILRHPDIPSILGPIYTVSKFSYCGVPKDVLNTYYKNIAKQTFLNYFELSNNIFSSLLQSLYRSAIYTIGPILQKKSERTLRTTSIIVAPFISIAEFYKRNFGEDKVKLIRGAIDTKLFSPLNLRNQKPELEILYVGWLITGRGIEILLKAFSMLLDTKINNKNIRLRIIGEGSGKKVLMQLARELNIYEHVTFQGAVLQSDLPKIYNDADIYCDPTPFGPFNKATLEALSCGKPLVAYSPNNLTDSIINNRNGILIKELKPENLKDSFINLLSDEHRMKRMGAQSRELALENFSLEKIVQQWFDLYRNLAVHN